MGGLSLPLVSALLHSWHVPRAVLLPHISFGSWATQSSVYLQGGQWGGGDEQCVGLWVGVRAMDDRQLWLEHLGPACQGSGSRILALDVSSSPHGSLASIRHNRALVQSSDFVGVLFNPRFSSLMNLFNMTSPQLNTVPFIIIICLQSCSQLSIPELCLPLPKSFWINFSIRISWDTDAVLKSGKYDLCCVSTPSVTLSKNK